MNELNKQLLQYVLMCLWKQCKHGRDVGGLWAAANKEEKNVNPS